MLGSAVGRPASIVSLSAVKETIASAWPGPGAPPAA